ncbi:hypothetical protein [Arsenicicoccus dermatophilus]|uniref:hypothetical protein n=1 Tax=Arsenicicoccus dermatophilus TaxID=1076331 RepID=UPI001F4C5B90|nr:hypothetical protein [Arsenicicoccus dermatophilus]MCH8613701.1 hypothetical protein [Arsenicicoccus dermatophilus]
MRTTARSLGLLTTSLLLAAGAVVAAPATPAEARTVCRTAAWGTGDKGDWRGGAGSYMDDRVVYRIGRHACFDRVVIDYLPVAGTGPAMRSVGYAGGVARPRGGHATIYVMTPGEIDPYTVVPKGYRSLVAVRLCDRHRMSVICIEVRRKVPYRVMDLAGPGAHRRLVVDVAHRR